MRHLLPVSVQSGAGRFEVQCLQPGPPVGRELARVLLWDAQGRCSNFDLDPAFLLQIADLIYRLCGKEPQASTRIEVVAAAAPAIAPFTVVAGGAGEDREKDEIKRKYMGGR